MLLLQANPKIFAVPTSRIIPDRIKAQFELEDDYYKKLSEMSLRKMRASRNKRKISISEMRQPTYQRDPDRVEGHIKPLETIHLTDHTTQPNKVQCSFENQVNRRFS